MTITISVPDQLADRAANQGLSVGAFVEQLAYQAAQTSLPRIVLGLLRKKP